jgi:hypothetical protein
MKDRVLHTPIQTAFVLATAVSLVIALVIALIIALDPGSNMATYSQSMLIVSGFSALFLALFAEGKQGKWWQKFEGECLNALLITALNLLVGWLFMRIFSLFPSAGQALFIAALKNPNSYFFLAAAFAVYTFFRVFFLTWQYLDHLRKQYFTWSLTYYFFFIVICLAFAFLLITTLYFSIIGVTALKDPSLSGINRILGWLVFNVMPVFGIFVGLLFMCLLVLVPPFALFSYFFAKN